MPSGGGTGGDPHFRGFDGQQYDIMGEPGKHYCLISARNFTLNARFAAFREWTIMDQVGLRFPGTGLFFDLSIEVGRPVVWMNHARVLWTATFDTGLRDTAGRPVPGGIQVLDRKSLVHAGRYILEVAWCDDHGAPHPKFGKLAIPHLDIYLYPAHSAGDADEGPLPHGLLGVTTRGTYSPLPASEQGDGVLDALEPGSTYRDYEVADLWSTGFKFNQYQG